MLKWAYLGVATAWGERVKQGSAACQKCDEKKYLLYDVKVGEGFNLQRTLVHSQLFLKVG